MHLLSVFKSGTKIPKRVELKIPKRDIKQAFRYIDDLYETSFCL